MRTAKDMIEVILIAINEYYEKEMGNVLSGEDAGVYYDLITDQETIEEFMADVSRLVKWGDS